MRGPLRPSWTLAFEIATRFFQAQDARVRAVAASGDIARCRAIADSLVFYRPVLNDVRIEDEQRVPGAWFIAPRPGPTVLYFHGGGYAFYPKMTDNIVAAVAMAVGRPHLRPCTIRSRRSIRFPPSSRPRGDAYRWLLESAPPSQIVFAGDSAGGHLALMLLLTLNDLPKPAAADRHLAMDRSAQRRRKRRPRTVPSTGCRRPMSDQLARWAGPEFTQHASLTEWPDVARPRRPAAAADPRGRSRNLPAT